MSHFSGCWSVPLPVLRLSTVPEKKEMYVCSVCAAGASEPALSVRNQKQRDRQTERWSEREERREWENIQLRVRRWDCFI